MLRSVDPVAALADTIRGAQAAWPEPVVERAVFGTDDPASIAAAVEAFCRRELGSPVIATRFWIASVGCVAGVDLADRRTVVVKAHQADRTRAFLSAASAVQRRVADTGLPCPRPLLGPVPLGRGWATVEAYLPDPGPGDGRAPGALEGAAAGLAEVVTASGPPGDVPALREHPQRTPTGRRWPRPHNDLFDFKATAAEAGWIDELADRARALRDPAGQDTVVGHGDWSSRNVRVRDGRVVAAYDWDSVAAMGEAVLVGQAAATWPLWGDESGPAAASPGEVAAFADAYAAARPAPLSPPVRRAIGPAALWVLAYVARCEHAIDREDGPGVGALRRHGGAYLDCTRA